MKRPSDALASSQFESYAGCDLPWNVPGTLDEVTVGTSGYHDLAFLRDCYARRHPARRAARIASVISAQPTRENADLLADHGKPNRSIHEAFVIVLDADASFEDETSQAVFDKDLVVVVSDGSNSGDLFDHLLAIHAAYDVSEFPCSDAFTTHLQGASDVSKVAFDIRPADHQDFGNCNSAALNISLIGLGSRGGAERWCHWCS